MTATRTPGRMQAPAQRTNPLRAGQRQQRSAPPATMVIFGASGDLTRRKLVPALYNLALEHMLPSQFTVVGVSRTPESDEQFRQTMHEGVDAFSRSGKAQPATWDGF